MFGLFKSKEDKKAEEIVEELREVINKTYNGNVVHELGSMLLNRYKLTASTFETIRTAGLLPGLDGSGAIAVAISKKEILFITFKPDRQTTEVQLAIYPEDMLEDIRKNLIIDNKIARHKEGTGYINKSDITIFIGALTLLGHEVGIGRDDRNFFPFKYKNNNFVLARHEEKLWIVFEKKPKTENINDDMGLPSVNQSAEDNLLESIKKLKESEGFIYSFRLKYINLVEVDNAIKKLNIENYSRNDIIFLLVDNKVYGIYEDDDTSIHITGYEEDYDEMDFQALKEGKYLGE